MFIIRHAVTKIHVVSLTVTAIYMQNRFVSNHYKKNCDPFSREENWGKATSTSKLSLRIIYGRRIFISGIPLYVKLNKGPLCFQSRPLVPIDSTTRVKAAGRYNVWNGVVSSYRLLPELISQVEGTKQLSNDIFLV